MGKFQSKHGETRAAGGRAGGAGARHSLTLPLPRPPSGAPQPLQPSSGERALKVSGRRGRGLPPGGTPIPEPSRPWVRGRCRGVSGSAQVPPTPALTLRPESCAPGRADGVGAPGSGTPLGRSARGAHGASPSHLGSRVSSRRAAGDSFVVSAHPSGRKGTEEAERRGGLEHRARDKQVGVDGCVGETRTRRCQSCAHGWDGSRRHRPRWPAGCDAS